MSAYEVQCDMPFSIIDIEIRWASIRWLLSVSNNNVTFSDTTIVFVFDSKCLECTTDTFTCRQKVFYMCVKRYVAVAFLGFHGHCILKTVICQLSQEVQGFYVGKDADPEP